MTYCLLKIRLLLPCPEFKGYVYRQIHVFMNIGKGIHWLMEIRTCSNSFICVSMQIHTVRHSHVHAFDSSLVHNPRNQKLMHARASCQSLNPHEAVLGPAASFITNDVRKKARCPFLPAHVGSYSYWMKLLVWASCRHLNVLSLTFACAHSAWLNISLTQIAMLLFECFPWYWCRQES